MSENSEKILVGKIVGFFGVKGWVKVHSYTEPKENILAYSSLWFKRKLRAGEGGKSKDSSGASVKTRFAWQTLELEDGKAQGKGLVVKLKEISDRTAAESWLGTEIYIAHEQLEKLLVNDYYWHDLIGCEVINEQERVLGKVKRILETGANDVLVLQPSDRLLPYIWEQVIKSVDITNKIIRVDWPEEYFA